MASIFTYDPDPPRVASPWLSSAETGSTAAITSDYDNSIGGPSLSVSEVPHDEGRVFRLQSEPQEGPVEYKLHLLLRPRRKFKSTSTGLHVSGSRHSKTASVSASRTIAEPAVDSGSGSSTPPAASVQQTRQHRLEQLTTQLLWRLQQSSPHHTSSATNIILPSLPEALPELQAPQQPAKLLHGLEESQGALYEIGVSDDGTLVGLAEDEMQESLNNLRAMAACLGCTVEILREETVGQCEWLEEKLVGNKTYQVRRSGKLMVAEALIKPLLQPNSPSLKANDSLRYSKMSTVDPVPPTSSTLPTEQLRITLTGPTMSGKSTLLGTLTTSTLDNGRGKSRLSMLKHRHEITSGITSSVTQELVGYQDSEGGDVEVINYAADNIASWIDVHVASAGSRLAFISDSAGHPRYRRTTLRGLVGWSPHWTLLCIPANDTEDQAGRTGGTGISQASPGASVDLSGAQLDLCLRLDLPLVIVITKLDLASRNGLRESLSKILGTLKAVGRKPAIIPNTPGPVTEEDLRAIDNALVEAACNVAVPLLNNPRQTVPIVLTSAVDGTGLRNLHALLHELPIPDSPSTGQTPALPYEIFDIEDVYNKPAEVAGVIVSGRLRFGHITVGDTLVVGPFTGHDYGEDSEDSDDRFSLQHKQQQQRAPHPPTSRSFPGALRASSHLTAASPSFHVPNQEWRRVTVTSVRNLRLPVHSLHTDQVGSIAIAPEQQQHSNDDGDGLVVERSGIITTTLTTTTTSFLSRIRKGMVLASIQPLATRTFGARFKREDLESLAVGNHVVLYICSVRASAKVVSARAPDSPVVDDDKLTVDSDGLKSSSTTTANNFDTTTAAAAGLEHTGPFAFDDLDSISQPPARVAGAITAPELLVTFSFDAGKEFVMLGDRVLVMPGGGPGLYGSHERGEKGMAGLEGFVGEVVEVAQ